MADELDHACPASVELLRQRAEEHVLSGGRDGDQVGAELRMELECERSLEEHVGPAGLLEDRQKGARDHEVGQEVAVERPLQLVGARLEQRGGGDEVAYRGDHGVRGPGLLGDAPAQDGGVALVAEVPDEGVQAAQAGFVDVRAQVLAQPAELLRGARRHGDPCASFQPRSADDLRGYEARITPTGRKALRSASQRHLADIRELFLDHVTHGQLEVLAEVWRRVKAANADLDQTPTPSELAGQQTGRRHSP